MILNFYYYKTNIFSFIKKYFANRCLIQWFPRITFIYFSSFFSSSVFLFTQKTFWLYIILFKINFVIIINIINSKRKKIFSLLSPGISFLISYSSVFYFWFFVILFGLVFLSVFIPNKIYIGNFGLKFKYI